VYHRAPEVRRGGLILSDRDGLRRPGGGLVALRQLALPGVGFRGPPRSIVLLHCHGAERVALAVPDDGAKGGDAPAVEHIDTPPVYPTSVEFAPPQMVR